MTRVVNIKKNKKNFTSPMLIQVKGPFLFKRVDNTILSNKHKALV